MGKFYFDYFIFGVWFFFLGSAEAQEFNPEFRQYSNEEGLSQSVVLTVFQDSKNFLWFGTEDGLNKFDGYNFTVYRYDPEDSSSISDNWIQRIFMEDNDGNIWMVTSDRIINVFHPKTNSFVKLIPSEKNRNSLPPFSNILFMKEDKNSLVWVSTDRGLFSIDKKNWNINRVFMNHGNAGPAIFGSCYDDGNRLWFGSDQGLFIRTKNNKGGLSVVNVENLRGQPIYGIEKTENIIWIVTPREIIGFKDASTVYRIVSFGSLLSSPPQKTDSWQLKFSPFVRKDSKDNLWICTSQGAILFNTRQGIVRAFRHEPSDTGSISSDAVTSFFEDHNGDIWLGTSKGLNRFIPEKNSFVRSRFKAKALTNTVILSVFEDKTGNILAKNQAEQSSGSQLFYLDKKSMALVQIKSEEHNDRGIPLDLVYDPFIDHQENIWFGTYGSGVLLYSPHQKKFDLIKHNPANSNSIAGNSSWAISEDPQGRLWLALFEDGLDCYDPATEKTIHYRDRIASFLHTKNLDIISVRCDKKDRVWFGTTGMGVICMDIHTGKMKLFKSGTGKDNQISGNTVFAITEDIFGNLIFCYPRSGIDILDPATGKVVNYKNIPGNPNSLYNNTVRYAIGTSDGNYWISSNGAITFLDRLQNKMTHYVSRKGGGKGILSDIASCIYEDSRGNIWVGTHGGGLALFDKKKQEFRSWMEKNGLINNVIYGILEDEKGRLWLSTNNGISCFDPDKELFINYYANDGLQGSEFNANSFYKDKKGKLYFGGIGGITNFYPSEIQADHIPPQVCITGFQIFNRRVEVLPSGKRNTLKPNSDQIVEDGNHLYLPENISYTRKLRLRYNYKVFTFEFAALRFDMPERCTYRYKMEGFEDEWNIAGNRRYATYTNLPPGEYVFNVTAANSDGIWNPEPVSIEIVITPPFYRTWWFVTFSIALLIVGSTAYVRRREQNLKKTKTLLEEKVKLRTHELNDKNEELTLRNIQIMKQKEEIAKQAKRLRDELDLQNKTSEQALLRSQINPHFLFNTLNNIYSLVYQKSASSPESIMKLSEIMRYMLYDTSSDRVLLEKEIQYLNSFIELQLLRLKNKEFVSFEINGDPAGKQIAPMLLIPFVENAFKHGNKSAPTPGIDIRLDCTPDKISFRVKNSKNKSTVKDSLGGIGLTNVKRRLELIYHEKYMLDIVDTDDKFNVALEIREK